MKINYREVFRVSMVAETGHGCCQSADSPCIKGFWFHLQIQDTAAAFLVGAGGQATYIFISYHLLLALDCIVRFVQFGVFYFWVEFFAEKHIWIRRILWGRRKSFQYVKLLFVIRHRRADHECKVQCKMTQ